MSPDQKELSIILPAFNEGEKIHASIEQVKNKADLLNISYEIVIVNDGSSDDTLEKAQKNSSDHIRVLSYNQNRGKGHAVHYGMKNSSGQYKLFMDVDLATSLDAIREFLNIMRSHEYDILIGNRRMKISRVIVKQPFYREFFGVIFTRLSSFFVGKKLTDFTCGFKMFNQKAVDILIPRQRIFGWAFDTELIYIATLHNLKIGEVPVEWSDRKGSRVRLLRDAVNSFYSLIKMRLNNLRGLYQ